MMKRLKRTRPWLGLLLAGTLLWPLASRADDETLIDSSGHPAPTAPEHPFTPLKDKPAPQKAAPKPPAHKPSIKKKRTLAKKHPLKKPAKKKKAAASNSAR